MAPAARPPPNLRFVVTFLWMLAWFSFVLAWAVLPMAWAHDVVGFLFLGMVGPLWLLSAICLVLALRPPRRTLRA